MRHALLFVPLFAVACSYPKFSASKVVEMELPAAQVSKLSCMTHNGDITVSPADSDEVVRVRAEMKVRGYTQEEADGNLHLLSVAHETDGDELKLYGKYPRYELNNRSPSFRFTLQVPERMALSLESHNGDIETAGTNGALAVETHNGDIEGSVDNSNVRVETHNGDVELAIQSPGDLAGRIETHNGNVNVTIDEGASGWLEAYTHNGSITPPRNIMDATIKRRSVRCRIGDETSEGKLRVETHNGNVRIRAADGKPVEYR